MKAFLLFHKEYHECKVEKENVTWEEICPAGIVLANSVEEAARICGGKLVSSMIENEKDYYFYIKGDNVKKLLTCLTEEEKDIVMMSADMEEGFWLFLRPISLIGEK